MQLKVGGDWRLEVAADEILHADRANFRAQNPLGHACVYGILSPDQWALRTQREVITKTGRFDVGWNLRGVYGRAWCEKSHRPTKARQFSSHQDPWRQFSYEHLDTDKIVGTWRPLATDDIVTSGQHYDQWISRDACWPVPLDALNEGQQAVIVEYLSTLRPCDRHDAILSLAEYLDVPWPVVARAWTVIVAHPDP